MLADHGHNAVGIDVDERVVQAARDAGFDVAQADALEDLVRGRRLRWAP